jgi:homoserine dehydrogenase
MDQLITGYYFRFSALDKPGVLSKISGILGANNIGIASVIQKGRAGHGSVPVVMLTHEAMERDVRKSLETLDKLDIVTERTVLFRVEKKIGV